VKTAALAREPLIERRGDAPEIFQDLSDRQTAEPIREKIKRQRPKAKTS
jgi:hypothetical protein